MVLPAWCRRGPPPDPDGGPRLFHKPWGLSSVCHLPCHPPPPAPRSSFQLPALAVLLPPSHPFSGSLRPPGQSPHLRSSTFRLFPHHFQPLAVLMPLPGHPTLPDTRLSPLPTQAGPWMRPPPDPQVPPQPQTHSLWVPSGACWPRGVVTKGAPLLAPWFPSPCRPLAPGGPPSPHAGVDNGVGGRLGKG